MPGASDVLVKYTYYGDANLDGVVNGADYARIDAGFLSKGALTGWYNGDFNYDGKVDASDYTLIDNAFNLQGAPFATLTAELAAPAATVSKAAATASVAAARTGSGRRPAAVWSSLPISTGYATAGGEPASTTVTADDLLDDGRHRRATLGSRGV